MGRYITYDEVTLRFPLLKTLSDKESHINSLMIYYAENQVDEMLAPAYSTPFSAAHPTVKDLSLDLCKYRMLLDQDAEKAASIAYTCLTCGRCKERCPVKIDVPEMVIELRRFLAEGD